MKAINKNQIKTKFEQLRWRVDGDVLRFKVWCKQNPEAAAALLSGSIAAGTYIGKAAIRHINLNKQEAVKVLYCYDRSLGHYWKLRRELTNKEWVEIDRRKRAGERLADILDEMKVLK